MIRESGGDRSAVTGGTRVLSDEIVVRITARPGETFLDRMISLVEGASPAEDSQRDRPQHPARGPHASSSCWRRSRCSPSPSTRGDEQTLIVLVALLVCLIPTTIGALLSAIGIAGHGPPRPAQRAGDVGSGRRGGRRLLDAAARQDRHDHARQPSGGRVPAPAPGVTEAELADAAQLAEPRRRDARGPVDRRARQGTVRPARAGPVGHATLVAFTAETRMSGVDIPDGAGTSGRVPPIGAALGAELGGQGRAACRRRRGRGHAHAARSRPRPAVRRGDAPRGPLVALTAPPAPSGSGPRRRPPQGRGEGGHAASASTQLRRDGHPHGDDHRRQPADRRGHRRRGRRRRLPRRGDARGQDGADPARAARAAAWSP